MIIALFAAMIFIFSVKFFFSLLKSVGTVVEGSQKIYYQQWSVYFRLLSSMFLFLTVLLLMASMFLGFKFRLGDWSRLFGNSGIAKSGFFAAPSNADAAEPSSPPAATGKAATIEDYKKKGYKLISKKHYRLKNLEGRPTIELEGEIYYVVRGPTEESP